MAASKETNDNTDMNSLLKCSNDSLRYVVHTFFFFYKILNDMHDQHVFKERGVKRRYVAHGSPF